MNEVSVLLIASGLAFILLLVIVNAIGRGWIPIRPSISRARARLERGLGLGYRDRRLLDRLARALELEERTPLLLGQGCFEEAVRRLDPGNELLARIEALRLRIHQEDDPAE